ncbi:MAG: ferrous iron transport protein B [Candidatus Cloacimonetes bacterium]|nr:ferrous iron transport protein B [Candidatus Cloacimonadota bacterium]
MNVAKKNKIIALTGNPNSGKTTLFNALTGTNQRIGNWPGVTVEKKTGFLNTVKSISNQQVEIVDLPGIYSLTSYSIDEEIARSFIINETPDLIINIVDVTNLERNLYLTTQLLQLRKPMIVCLNMMDLAEKMGTKIDLKLFEGFLGCPVVPISALKKAGIEEIKHHIENVELPDCLIDTKNKSCYVSDVKIPYDEFIVKEIDALIPDINGIAIKLSLDPFWFALKMLENDPFVIKLVNDFTELIPNRQTRDILLEKAEQAINRLHRHTKMQVGILIADGRYSYIKGICREILKKQQTDKITISDKIDKVLLHPFVGIPFFMIVIYLKFMFSITLSGPFIDFIDIFFGGLFIDGFSVLLTNINLPEWLIIFLADGIGGGITTVMTFIPPIFFIFLVLSFLEESGYMARVAFIMDKFMHWLGLSGKSIIPMVVGFGCTVPAIMATRTLENKRDRLMTIMLVPFISCGAKIPVYVMFAMLFFPEKAGLVIFLLYLTGFFLAIITGQIIKRLAFKGEPSEFVMELPAYHLPTFNGVFLHTWQRLKGFISRAGKTILIVIILLTMINAVPIRTNPYTGENDTILTYVGKAITPVFIPMGIEKDNWQATVSLVVGLFAKEAIVGSFEALYITEIDTFDGDWSISEVYVEAKDTFLEDMGVALQSIIYPFKSIDDLAEEYENDMLINQKRQFKNIHQVIAYLLFILIYAPCVAAIAVAYKEAGRKLATVQLVYLTILAWIVATIYYNIAVFTALSIIWFCIAGIAFAGLLVMFDKIKIDISSEIKPNSIAFPTEKNMEE